MLKIFLQALLDCKICLINGKRKLYAFRDMFRFKAIFALLRQFDNFWSEASGDMSKAVDNLCEVVFSHDILVSQKFRMAQSKDGHNPRTGTIQGRAQSKDGHDIRMVDDTKPALKLSSNLRVFKPRNFPTLNSLCLCRITVLNLSWG